MSRASSGPYFCIPARSAWPGPGRSRRGTGPGSWAGAVEAGDGAGDAAGEAEGDGDGVAGITTGVAWVDVEVVAEVSTTSGWNGSRPPNTSPPGCCRWCLLWVA